MRATLEMPRPAGPCVDPVRVDMLERGFSLVHTPRYFDDDLFLRLGRTRTVLPFHDPRWRKLPQLARYACWLEALLRQALAEESLCLASLEYRQEPAGAVDNEVDRLHADGSYLRSVYTPYGRTTVYRDRRVERSVPCGQTLLMTALDRARARGVPCTLHRRPGVGPERAVIVGSFEPCREQPLRADVYRRASQPHDKRRGSIRLAV